MIRLYKISILTGLVLFGLGLVKNNTFELLLGALLIVIGLLSSPTGKETRM